MNVGKDKKKERRGLIHLSAKTGTHTTLIRLQIKPLITHSTRDRLEDE